MDGSAADAARADYHRSAANLGFFGGGTKLPFPYPVVFSFFLSFSLKR